jgi:transposase
MLFGKTRKQQGIPISLRSYCIDSFVNENLEQFLLSCIEEIKLGVRALKHYYPKVDSHDLNHAG